MTVWILVCEAAFRFWIAGTRIGYALRSKYSHASSSPIQNPKAAPRTKSGPADQNGAGFFALAVVFVLCGAVAEAQQQAKLAKIGWLGARSSSSAAPGRRQFDVCSVSAAMLRIKTSLSSFERLITSLIGSPLWLMSWSVSKLTCSSRARRAAALAAKNATRTIPIVFYERS